MKINKYSLANYWTCCTRGPKWEIQNFQIVFASVFLDLRMSAHWFTESLVMHGGCSTSRIWAGVEWQQARCPSLHFLLAEASATKPVLLSTGCPSATHASSLHVLTKRLLCDSMSQVLCQVLSYRVSQNRHGPCPHGAYSQAVVMHNR